MAMESIYLRLEIQNSFIAGIMVRNYEELSAF